MVFPSLDFRYPQSWTTFIHCSQSLASQAPLGKRQFHQINPGFLYHLYLTILSCFQVLYSSSQTRYQACQSIYPDGSTLFLSRTLFMGCHRFPSLEFSAKNSRKSNASSDPSFMNSSPSPPPHISSNVPFILGGRGVGWGCFNGKGMNSRVLLFQYLWNFQLSGYEVGDLIFESTSLLLGKNRFGKLACTSCQVLMLEVLKQLSYVWLTP